MKKQVYKAPEIVQISIDNDISLILTSQSETPPWGPGE